MSIQLGQRFKHLENKVVEMEKGVGNLAGMIEAWEDRITALEEKLQEIPRGTRRRRPVDEEPTE